MFIEQPPMLYRLLFPEAIWRIKQPGIKAAYLTFDDGPIPEVTPDVLDILDRYGVKATFFSFLLKIIFEFVFEGKDNNSDAIPQKHLANYVTIPHF